MYRFPSKHLLSLTFLLSAAVLPLSPLFAATACMDEFIANQTVDIRMQTDLGGIDIRLRGDVAPITVENFCRYIDSGDYDGTYFHRNITGFVAQAGGFKFIPENGSFFGGGKTDIPVNDPIVNEAGLPGALSNITGTLAMAKKAGDPDSATSQWFFNVADNSGEPPNGLDFQNGGFTVFAEVQGDDLTVVEDISAQDVCQDIPGLGTVVCGDNAATIQIGASRPGSGFETDNLLVVNYVGLDTDGDGIVDGVESAAPDTDVDRNGTQDVNQKNIASFDNVTGEYSTLQSPGGTVLQSTDVLSPAYAIAHPATSFCFFKDIDFTGGFVGTEVSGTTPGAATTVDLTLPVGVLPDTFYSFGPTLGDPEPHWYEFLFNGETGAEINASVVRLHYVDGKRGDSDIDNANGVISTITGPAFMRTEPREEDGIQGFVEDGGPNDGDANNDGIKDSEQPHVANFPDLNTVRLILASDSVALPLQVIDNNAPVGIPDEEIQDTLEFTHGFVRFDVCADTVASVEMTVPIGEMPDTFFLFGPTEANPELHYHEFLFDGQTGAEIIDNSIKLHFVDGGRGDTDGEVNGVITVSPGGPAKRQGDTDGVADEVEDAAPNNGDGNDDAVADRNQSHVSSLTDAIRNDYITVVATIPSQRLRALQMFTGLNILLNNTTTMLEGLNFPHGFVGFEVKNIDVDPAGKATVRLILPPGERPVAFFMFGPTPDNEVDHLYKFNFDGETGARFEGNEVVLHFVDGSRGDSDLESNGTVDAFGAPAAQAGNSLSGGGGGGGGCSLSTNATPWQAGDWWLLLLLISLVGAWRIRQRVLTG